MSRTAKIELRNIGRTFTGANGEKVEAVRGVTFTIDDLIENDGRDVGEFRVILGPSGCGKSTILRMVAGLDEPTTGEVLVNGKRVEGPGADRGMVFQKYTSFAWLTVEQNIAYGLDIKGTPASERDQIVGHLLEATGLKDFARAYPHTLSGGMQQRVAIARSLAVKPQVLLMDEPFGALDAQTRNEMQALLLRVWEETASTIVFVTHDVAEAVFLADHIFIMTARPGSIADEILIPFRRPRDPGLRDKPEFREIELDAVNRLRRAASGGQIRLSV
ncbi:MAG: ABC transporter ATP-binding protein [Bryobacteraceae bacterium]